MQKIIWTKKYYEDVSEKDESGDYSYTYRYYIYLFTLPSKLQIKARRYTDSPDQCSLFAMTDTFDFKTAITQNYFASIVNFLRTKESIKKIEYFSNGYKPVDLAKVSKNLKDFVLEKGE